MTLVPPSPFPFLRKRLSATGSAAVRRSGMGSLIAAALARAQGFLLEPGVAEQAHAAAVREPPAAAAPVTVVVTGLSREAARRRSRGRSRRR